MAVAGGRRRRMLDVRQAVAVAAGLDQRVDAIEAAAQALDGVGGVIGRQQAGVAAQERRREADGEAVAIEREVEHLAARRQALRQRRRVGDELAPRKGLAAAMGERRVERAAGERDGGRAHAVRSGSCGAAGASRLA